MNSHTHVSPSNSHRPAWRRVRGILFACLMLSGSPAQADVWPTTEFEVIAGPPVARHWGEGELADYLDLILPFFDDDFGFVDEMEVALSRIARRYEAMGFPEPMLEPIVTRDDGKLAYRVFVCQKSWVDKLKDDTISKMDIKPDVSVLVTLRSAWDTCGEVAAHMGNCAEGAGFRNYIYFNNERMLTNSSLGFWDYETMAHELFHAVQAGSAWGQSSSPCDTGSWIVEGSADAIGVDLVRELWPDAPYYSTDHVKEYGIRMYSAPLATRNKQFVYQTSSFWRHAGEWYHAMVANAGRRSGSAQTESNYGYLVHLLKQPMVGTAGLKRELRWLDEGLRSTPRLTTNLAWIYSEFTASLVDQLRTRIVPGYGKPPAKSVGEARMERFLRALFGPPEKTAKPCRQIALSPSIPVWAEDFVLASVASDCFELTVQNAHGKSAPEQVVVTISTGPSPRRKLAPLWIGKSGGMEVSQLNLFMPEDRDEAPGYGSVQFRVKVGKPTIFTLSNVAHYAQESEFLRPRLTFLMDGWDSSLTKAPPPRKAPVNPRPKARPDDARGEHEKELDEQFADGLGRLTSNGLGSTDMSRNFGEFGGCDGARKRYNLCGPTLEIELELVSAAAASVATSTSGGFFNQMRAGGVGRVAEMSLPELMALTEAKEEMSPKFIEGGRITISIPRIDYGFAGSFDNALIEVSKEGGGNYVSNTSSPVVISSGGLGPPVQRRVPNGKVTIEEYTPFVLRGKFEASLLERRNDRPVPPHETVPVANQISGYFSVANPFEEDREYKADEASFRQQMGLDVLDNPGLSADGPVSPQDAFTPEEIQHLCEMGIDDHLLEGMGISGGCANPGSGQGASEEAPCACDCEEFESPRRVTCQAECTSEYSQCAVDGDDPQMEKLLNLLRESSFPEPLKQQYIAEFPTMNAEDRQALLDLLELTAQFGTGD